MRATDLFEGSQGATQSRALTYKPKSPLSNQADIKNGKGIKHRCNRA
jgi:hypothetical protein